MSASPGWAHPLNALYGEPRHWWRPDGRMACSPSTPVGYVGRKDKARSADACPACVDVVTAAVAVLGDPER